ncbi:MAG: hypothetical protein M3008_03630 [Chloroflexota bacterium]|nr:hypothetical protein [Chloroflexota bacterium]
MFEHDHEAAHPDALVPFPLLVPPFSGDGERSPPMRRAAQLRRTAQRLVATVHWMQIPAIVVLALSLALLVGKAIGVAQYEMTILRYPFQIDDAEGVILAEATLIAHGTNPYASQPSPAHHFYAGPYTPLYTGINAAVVRIAGPTFAVGRAVQLLAMFAVAIWLAWAVSHSTSGRIGWFVGIWVALLLLT